MLKKSLIALALVAFLGLPAMAHPNWGYSVETIWHWEVKHALDVCVKIKVVRWADVYFADDKDKCLVLKQTDGDVFEDCIGLKVCNNFPGVKIMAKFVYTAGDPKVADKYFVKLSGGGKTNEGENKTDIVVDDVHLSNNLMPLELCLRATGVDPQALDFTQGKEQEIGKVEITLVPTM